MRSIISVALLPQLLPSDWARTAPIAVVIDTLRFTSTACVALAAGARAVTVLSDIERAKQQARDASTRPLLCGERHCVRIPGFDLGNSPSEYTAASVASRELIFSTTNGTVAVEAAAPAHEIILASLLNRGAACLWLDQTERRTSAVQAGLAMHSIWCVCAGTDGQVAYEDVLTAGAIIDWLTTRSDRWQLGNDACLLALDAWKQIAGSCDMSPDKRSLEARSVWSDSTAAALVDRLGVAAGGRNLIDAGFAADLTAVAQLDTVATVPYQHSPGRFHASAAHLV